MILDVRHILHRWKCGPVRQVVLIRFNIILICLFECDAWNDGVGSAGFIIDLRFETASGCYIAADGAGLWSSLLDPATTIHLEAEQAENLAFQKDRQVGGALTIGQDNWDHRALTFRELTKKCLLFHVLPRAHSLLANEDRRRSSVFDFHFQDVQKLFY